MNTKSVQVVMSTYNGEKYLKEQIDSILSQEGVDVRLYIRDDGSSDRTTDILASYQEHKNVKIETRPDGRPFFGVLGMSILYRVKVPSLPASGKD